MRKLLKDNSGIAAPIIFIIAIPMMFLLLSSSIQITNTITTSDVSIQESVAIAAKNAASAMNTEAQAKGIIRINTGAAHDNFRQALIANLSLDSSLEPTTESFSSAPKYWLLVYNGYEDYTGVKKACVYNFDGNTLTESNFSVGGFPKEFAIDSTGIKSGVGGDYTVELETPGVIAVVSVETKRIIGGSNQTITRWASARIVSRNGKFKVI